jgi:hypothetical protein
MSFLDRVLPTTTGHPHHVLVDCDKTKRMEARKVSRSIDLNIVSRKAQR